MSGGGISSDDRGSIFFATGNGHASQLSTIPVAGRNPPTALEEAAVHMTINEDGTLNVVDFFMPWEKPQLDGADKDLGTTPLEILPSQFSCGDVKRIGVVTGKSGKTYWLNLDDMGGYRNGPDGLDRVLQVYQNENSVYAGAGVYPLEGGYIYINVIQYPSHVFKFQCTEGVPSFTKVADSPDKNAYILGVGHGTVTSLNNQPGTGLLWTSDVQGFNLRVYNAVPVGGLLQQIARFNVPGVTKFTRPVFGDGRVYLGTNQGFFYGFGSPVNLPLNCTAATFGVSNIGVQTASQTITCKANIALQVTNITLGDSADFSLSGRPIIPLTVAAGATFSVQTAFKPSTVGIISSDIVISTLNNVEGYSISTPVSLTGEGQSTVPLLAISPPVLAFRGIIIGEGAGGVNQSALFANQGNSALTITNIEYSMVDQSGPYIPASGTSSAPKVGPFTFYGLPTTIAPNSVSTVNINFNSAVAGNFGTYLKVTTNGGTKYFSAVGTAGAAPVALVEFQTIDGGSWVPYSPSTPFTFGNVTENQTRYLKMRITNAGPEFSAKLSLTISKPPFGGQTIINANNQVDLGEGISLAPGETASATLSCNVPKSQVNVDPYTQTSKWTLNFNDPAFGKKDMNFVCTAVSEQNAPLAANGNGTGIYRYKGCFRGSDPGRKLLTRIYSAADNTNGKCMAACYAQPQKYQFASTEYHSECWCGNEMPPLQAAEGNCNFDCSGNINDICGGNGLPGKSGSYFSLFVDTSRGLITAPVGPSVNPGVDGYVSQGCYKEAMAGRALSVGKSISANATVYNCIQACKGYTFAGLEYGQECYCGDAIDPTALPTVITECNMLCKGNSTEYCGAGSRLNVYKLGGVVLSSSISTTLSTSTTSSTSSRSSTTTTSSSSSSYTSSLTRSSTTTSSTTSPSPSPPPSSTASTSTSTSATKTSTSAPGTPTSTSGWVPLGCYVELTPRLLSLAATASDTMTPAVCQSFCASKSYPYAGVEYGRECYCGSSLGSSSTPGQSGCTMMCAGDPLQVCGGSNRLNVYNNMAFNAPALVPAVGNYSLQGCYSELAQGRAVQGYMFTNSTGMRPSLCVDACSSRGYAVAGVEYGQECWCGATLNAAAAKVDNSRCNFVCPGAASELCGAGGTLVAYKAG